MPGTVVGVASERDMLMLELPRRDGTGDEASRDLMALLDEHGVSGKQLHQGPGQLTLIISRENLHEEARVRDALARRLGERLQLVDDIGTVSVIGAGINASFTNVRKGSDALAAAGIAIRGLATSSFRITWTIARDRLNDAVRVLHQLFIADVP
jgi:aspartate kinase